MTKQLWAVAGMILIALELIGCARDPSAPLNDCFAPRLLPSPDGKRLCVSVQRGGVCRIAVMRPDGTGLKILTDDRMARDSPAWSPDMKSLVYSGEVGSARAIFLLDLVSGHSRQISHPNGQLDMYPSFSPDGTLVTFARSYLHRAYSMGGWSWNNWDICVVDVTGTRERRLTHKDFYLIGAPYFSLDGRSLLCSADVRNAKATNGDIVEISLDNGNIHDLTEGLPSDDDPSFAPGEAGIVFSSDRGYEQRAPGPPIWTMDRHGRHIRQLVTIPGTPVSDVASPIYAPNGRDVFFTTQLDDSPHYAGWRLDVKGKTLRRIAGPEVFSDQ